MKSIRMLIVEDDKDLLARLKHLYREAFANQGFGSVTIEQAETVIEARDLARQAQPNPYDLVSLDVNLGDADSTGLDVLASLKRFRSAWMVALLTGVETDKSLDKTMGADKAGKIRRHLRRDAYARFPAERLMVVEKPSATLPDDESKQLLANRIQQIALIYEEVARLRYIFRPIEVVSLERVKANKGKGKPKRQFIESESLHWQIRFNCGDIRTLTDRAGLRTLHHLLSMDRSESLPAEQALAIEPRVEKEEPSQPVGADPVAAYFESQGIRWSALSATEQENLIKAALSLRFKRYVELRGFEASEDISPEEEEQLARIEKELGPLADAAEAAYQRLTPSDRHAEREMTSGERAQNELHTARGNFTKEQGRLGYDSPHAQNFRKRMERTRDYLRENGFADLAKHLEDYLMSTGANWSYNPPDGVEWTTS